MQCLGKARWDWNSKDLTRHVAPLGSGAITELKWLSLYDSQASPTFPMGLGELSVYPWGGSGYFQWGGFRPTKGDVETT